MGWGVGKGVRREILVSVHEVLRKEKKKKKKSNNKKSKQEQKDKSQTAAQRQL